MTTKQIKEQAVRYAKHVGWSDEGQCFVGHGPDLMLGGVHGNEQRPRSMPSLCRGGRDGRV